ncbi:MAG: LysR family transcriptional regulator [Gammaproteobacteria bacterium]
MNKSLTKTELSGVSRLNFHHLLYFWAVAREGHLTRAAERLHVSASALSAQIRQLETQLGEPLFVREGRSLRLTETGRLVLSYAEDIFSLGEELIASVRGRGTGGLQRLRIGSVGTLSRNFQENWVRPLLQDAEVSLSLESGHLEALLPRLQRHQLDVVLANQSVAGDAEHPWRCRLLARQPVCLVGPPGAWAERRFRFPEDLDGADLVLPGPRSTLRSRFDALCEAVGARISVRAEADDMAMLRLLARDSGVLALLPEVVVQDELEAGRLEVLCPVPGIEERFYAVTVPRRHHPAALKRLMDAEPVPA